ncbi:unnamed protein product [Pleuronectes platessa]|uniref:Uncharacterized protein n=1 Tax=Pleuronectes platessa TaxID=8262 RepID=A0A9N7YZA8_PLEPL|nr:unnamed protein product [Pleuronectes platessa]
MGNEETEIKQKCPSEPLLVPADLQLLSQVKGDPAAPPPKPSEGGAEESHRVPEQRSSDGRVSDPECHCPRASGTTGYAPPLRDNFPLIPGMCSRFLLG